MRAMKFRREDWAELLDDEEHGGALIPILALVHEHDPDPTLRPYQEPITADRRDQSSAWRPGSGPSMTTSSHADGCWPR